MSGTKKSDGREVAASRPANERRRVLVPLDGSELAETILPDARRLAGSDGVLILVRDVPAPFPGIEANRLFAHAVQGADEYLQGMAQRLRAPGHGVEVHSLTMRDVPFALDQAAISYRADFVALATRGLGPVGRLIKGGVAWRALAGSPVPVLMRRPSLRSPDLRQHQRTIMVPLDGSYFAEDALPLASRLVNEWQASLLLVLVIPTTPMFPIRDTLSMPELFNEELSVAREYLDVVRSEIPGTVRVRALPGSSIVESLSRVVAAEQVTDVVLTSHGRTGLGRVILGSVADGLIQRLDCPVIVVPVGALHTASHDKRRAVAMTM